ncbi:NAD-dependent epimerase/dehydratase family protein [Streptomyces pseudovenezuelae]|uniref:Nucleoside-diphosphate-sugar epimerase n=1 Tax=Streptomyces pseudovenezuelae TaxID=67350 RepID=A0ABT6LC14_9ACTN|nr:NAD-dependent epimerase/dehydratase family protein [Streptomyces pseudovenezuelae]MDH6213161.1 nucleoside-diphosphate-sugar epimerase [Streptomyces pseudovenezuelae]
MDIIGKGFIARHLWPLREAHPGVTVLAAGVPRQQLPDSEHEREAELVRDTVARCRNRGELLVFFSTASMYGGPGCRGREDDPVVPTTRYGRHKFALERVVRESGVDHLVLRLAYVLGPHGPDFRLVPALVSQVRAGRVRVHPGARRDLLHVADFVTLVDALLASGVRDETVNVASGDCVDVLDVVAHLKRRLALDAEEVVAGGGESAFSHCPSVARLRALLPESAGSVFGPGYHRRALDRYLRQTGDWSAPTGGQ